MLKQLLSLLVCWPALVLAQSTPGQLGVGNGTGTPPAVPATGYFYFEALNPIATSWAWIPDSPLLPGKGGILNCDFNAQGNCVQHWFPYPNAACQMGMNWSGTQWTCATVDQMLAQPGAADKIAAALQAAGYTLTTNTVAEHVGTYTNHADHPDPPVRCINGLPVYPDDYDYCTSHFNPGGSPILDPGKHTHKLGESWVVPLEKGVEACTASVWGDVCTFHDLTAVAK